MSAELSSRRLVDCRGVRRKQAEEMWTRYSRKRKMRTRKVWIWIGAGERKRNEDDHCMRVVWDPGMTDACAAGS
jgi:hypothetical protein